MEYLSDSLDIASSIEELDRVKALNEVIGDIPRNRDIESLIIPELECIYCGDTIPVARQRIVLSISDTCDMCTSCQIISDKRDRLYCR